MNTKNNQSQVQSPEELRAEIARDLAACFARVILCDNVFEKRQLFLGLNQLWKFYFNQETIPDGALTLLTPANGMNFLNQFISYAERLDFKPSLFWGIR